jgi:hypothetical protein
MKETSTQKNSKVIGIFLTLRWKFELNSNEYGESNYKLDTHVKNNLPIFTSPPRHGQFDTNTKIDPTQGCKWDTMSQYDYCKKGFHVLFPKCFFHMNELWNNFFRNSL